MRVRSLGQKDVLWKEMATHSSIHAWKIPWAEKPGGLQSQGLLRTHTHSLSLTHTHTHTKQMYMQSTNTYIFAYFPYSINT